MVTFLGVLLKYMYIYIFFFFLGGGGFVCGFVVCWGPPEFWEVKKNMGNLSAKTLTK